MRIATWCIGGVLGYLEVLCHWLERRCPDVVALQKICAKEERFPADALCRVGYRSYPLRRQTLYGVALLARDDLSVPEILERGLPGGDCPDDDGLLTARVGSLVVSSVYAPYGDPKRRGKDGALAYKIAWLDRLIAHLEERAVGSDRFVLCGDFNVLPDVGAKSGVLNCTPEEQQRLQAILGTGFVDIWQCVNPPSDPGFNYDFNRCLPPSARLQLILGSESVAASALEVWVDEEYRAAIDELRNPTWPASAPVIADLGDPP